MRKHAQAPAWFDAGRKMVEIGTGFG